MKPPSEARSGDAMADRHDRTTTPPAREPSNAAQPSGERRAAEDRRIVGRRHSDPSGRRRLPAPPRLRADQRTGRERMPGPGEPFDARMVDLLCGAGWLLGGPQELGSLVEMVLGGLEDVLGAERSSLFLLRRESEEAKPRLVLRQERARDDAIGWPAVEPAAVGALLDGPAVYLGAPRVGEIDGRPVGVVPLLDGGESIGALCVESPRAASWSSLEKRVLGMLGRLGGTAIGNARRWREHLELDRMRAALFEARAIQERLLPHDLPRVPGYELAAFNETCLEVGGDLWDVECRRGGPLHLVIGDVRGKGPGAALLMAEMLGAMRALRRLDVGLDRTVRAIDGQLLRWSASTVYATLFVGSIDLSSHRLDYVSAGHPSGLLVCGDGKIQELPSSGPPVGLLPEHEVPFEEASVELPPDCRLVLYTDGLTEAEPEDPELDELFGDRRFFEVLRECPRLDAQGSVDRIREALDAYRGRGERTDDVTLVVLGRVAA